MTDAWKQYDNLYCKYTQEWNPRPDLKIIAHGLGRDVEIQIGERREPNSDKWAPLGKFIWHSAGPRNVSTMRELAQSLLDACDFVDESNPKWASH